jgi:hypothetical protein
MMGRAWFLFWLFAFDLLIVYALLDDCFFLDYLVIRINSLWHRGLVINTDAYLLVAEHFLKPSVLP